MDPAVGGSNPLTHPIFILKRVVSIVFLSFVGGGIGFLLFGYHKKEFVFSILLVVLLFLSLFYVLSKKRWILFLMFFIVFSTFFYMNLKKVFLHKRWERISLVKNSGYREMEFLTLNVYGDNKKNSSMLVSTVGSPAVKLRLYYKKTKVVLYEGERIKAYGKLSCFDEYGHFKRTIYDVENFFSEKSCGFFVKSEMLIEKEGIYNYFYYIVSKLRIDYYEFLKKNLSSKKANFLSAIFLGIKRGLSYDTKRKWQDSGVYHFLAISGLHIAVLSFIIFQFFRFIGVSERKVYLIEIFAMIFFILFTGKMAPVLRAGFIVILYFLAKLLYRDSDLLHFVFLSGIIFLTFKPELIFDISFVLSYSMFVLISFVARDIEKYLPSINKSEKTVMIIILISIFSQLWSVLFFNRISYVSFIPNIFLSLLLPLILGLNFVALLFFKFIPSVSVLIIKIVAIAVEVSEWIVKFFSSSYIRVPDFDYSLYGICLVLIVGFFSVKKLKTKLIFLIAFILVISIAVFYPESKINSLELHFLDVHTGDSIFLRYPEKYNILIDCGGSEFVGEYVVSKYLFSLGVKSISSVFITHLHRDHFGGCKPIFKNFEVKRVYIYKPMDEWEVVKYLRENSIKNPLYVMGGEKIRIGEGKFTVIYPEKERANLFSNSESLALVFNYYGMKFIFPSDLNHDELEYVSRSIDGKYEILKFPHHGSRRALNKKFLTSTSPEITVITVGKENPWGFPHKEVIQSLKKINTIILRNDKHGTINIIYKKINKKFFRKIQASY